MKINVNFENNIIPDKYGKYAPEEYRTDGKPTLSFPFEISEFPKETTHFCIEMIDPDSIPVIGMAWIHWVVANVDVKMANVPENFSMDDSYQKMEGLNTYSNKMIRSMVPASSEIFTKYVGPGAPDKDHEYLLTVYAIKNPLNLENGKFHLNEMHKELEGNVLEKTTIKLIGRS